MSRAGVRSYRKMRDRRLLASAARARKPSPFMIERYAVFGNPIAHSKSPDIHAAFARSLHTTIEYNRELAPVDGLRAAVDAFRRNGGRGANVTVPFKVEAFALATHCSPRAIAAGAG
jgi:shikimate dehydrogenase